MINIKLTLVIGKLVNGEFDENVKHDLKLDSWDEFSNKYYGYENINSVLNYYKEEENYAELRLSIDKSTLKHLLLASFKRIKLKDKGNYWVLVY